MVDIGYVLLDVQRPPTSVEVGYVLLDNQPAPAVGTHVELGWIRLDNLILTQVPQPPRPPKAPDVGGDGGSASSGRGKSYRLPIFQHYNDDSKQLKIPVRFDEEEEEQALLDLLIELATYGF